MTDKQREQIIKDDPSGLSVAVYAIMGQIYLAAGMRIVVNAAYSACQPIAVLEKATGKCCKVTVLIRSAYALRRISWQKRIFCPTMR